MYSTFIPETVTIKVLKIKLMSLARYVLFLSVLIIMTSCTKYISLYPLPELIDGSPLKGIEPTSFIVNDFEDQRLEKEYIGVAGDKLKAKEDPSKVLPDALKTELRRNGHLISQNEGSDGIDFIINGNLINYYCIVMTGFWTGTGNSRVESVITVTDANTHEIKLTKKYAGFYEKKSVWGISGKELLDEALNNLVKEFTMDPELINLLQRAKQ
jgi:uncharacterized lipoprotein YajG